MKNVIAVLFVILFSIPGAVAIYAQGCPVESKQQGPCQPAFAVQPADFAFNYYDRLNAQEAQRTTAMFQGVNDLVRRGLVQGGAKFFIAQALIENIADQSIAIQLRYNSARDDEDKLRAAADFAALLRLWPRPQEILKSMIDSAPPPKPAENRPSA